MDFQQTNANITKHKVSILQGDEFFFNRITSRNSSLGCSSRVFYYRSSEGVPFQWEMQPGTPKDPPKQDFLPPISPPPAVISLALPKPCIDTQEPNKASSIRSRLKFWKYILKIRAIRKAYNGYKRTSQKENTCLDQVQTHDIGSDKFERFEFYSFNEDFMASPRNLSFSSSSTLLSFSNGTSTSSQLSRSESNPIDSIHGIISGCSPWNFTSSSLASVARKA